MVGHHGFVDFRFVFGTPPFVLFKGRFDTVLIDVSHTAADLVQGDVSDNWNRVNILLNSVEEFELIGPNVSSTNLLLRLFHEEKPRVFEAQKVEFGCTCSEDRVRQSLSIYSAKDISTMTTDDGRVTADCQFCGAHYDLDPATVGKAVTADG